MKKRFLEIFKAKSSNKNKKPYITKDIFTNKENTVDATSIKTIDCNYAYTSSQTCYVNRNTNELFMARGSSPLELTISDMNDYDFDNEDISVQEYVDIALKTNNIEALKMLDIWLAASSKMLVFGKDKVTIGEYINTYHREKINFSAYALAKHGLPRGVVHMILGEMPEYTVEDKVNLNGFVNGMISKGLKAKKGLA